MVLEDIKGLGQKRITALNEKGIKSVEDLALYFPKTYYDLDSADTFQEDGKYKLLNVQVISQVKVSRIRKTFSYSYCECLDIKGNKFKAVWYNQPYIKNAVKNEDKLYLYGKNSNTKHNYFVVSNFINHKKVQKENNLFPIYKSFKNLGQTVISSAIDNVLNATQFNSILPKDFQKQNLYLSYDEAIRTIHNPLNKQDLQLAKERLDIEKLLPIIKLNNDLKNNRNVKKTQSYMEINNIFNQFCSFLPYKLTNSQEKVLNEIIFDLKKQTPMNRLIQGDVGAGKTIVALISCAICVSNGYSAFIIAPTEILANQHYLEAKKYFNLLNLNTRLLTSSVSSSEKNIIYNELKSNPTLVIGTQACLNENINLGNTGLVVIDEQHRFGVKQRASLINRNPNIDLLSLSATPIPRSLSIVYYGGLDISMLDNTPKEKLVQTNIVAQNKEDDMWSFIENKISTGSKVYVVCANIDDNDDDTYENLSVKSMYKFLCNRFSKDLVLMAHGKQDSETENKTLLKFKNDNYKILVSTTIIEVGIDIKEADIIVIVSPEKFGLATMHQLRGRVGRNGQQSYCFCLSRNFNETSYERTKYFKEHLNGFDIAEYDYKSRGAGNILGTNQHGKIENIFSFVSLKTYEKAKSIYQLLKETNNTECLYNKDIEDSLRGIALN